MKKKICFTLMLWWMLLLCGCNVGSDSEVDESLWTRTPSLVPSPTITIQWFPPTDTPEPARTMAVEATPDMRPGVADVILRDSFNTPSHWNLGVGPTGSVAFGNNDLTLAISKSKETLISLRDGPTLENFALEITVRASLCKGNDYYGVLFRAASPQDHYRFAAACNGSIRVDRIKGGYSQTLFNWTPSGQVPPGAPVTVRLGVWAMGREMRFFVNDVYQFSVTDRIFSNGRVGVYARSMGESAMTVSFSDLVVYSLGSAAIPTSTPKATPLPTLTASKKGK